jgi:hypothetical protein
MHHFFGGFTLTFSPSPPDSASLHTGLAAIKGEDKRKKDYSGVLECSPSPLVPLLPIPLHYIRDLQPSREKIKGRKIIPGFWSVHPHL